MHSTVACFSRINMRSERVGRKPLYSAVSEAGRAPQNSTQNLKILDYPISTNGPLSTSGVSMPKRVICLAYKHLLLSLPP